MPAAKTITVYLFNSPCGEVCYIGQTRDLPRRIGKHRTDSTSSIFRHCSRCKICKPVARQRGGRSGWTECFLQLGSTTRKRRASQLETRFINAAFSNYIRNPQRKRFPLNKTAGSGGNPDLLRAARNTRKRRDKYASVHPQRGSIRSRRTRDVPRRTNTMPEGRRNRAQDPARIRRRQEQDSLRSRNQAQGSGCRKIARMAMYALLLVIAASLILRSL